MLLRHPNAALPLSKKELHNSVNLSCTFDLEPSWRTKNINVSAGEYAERRIADGGRETVIVAIISKMKSLKAIVGEHRLADGPTPVVVWYFIPEF
jgi:hypothetical protein